MVILRNLKVPTGNILIVQGELGKLEMLSLGDYGKDINVKCDGLGLAREIQKVEHQKLLPLEEKWVITISSQYGCNINCLFCDTPKVGPGRNATKYDLISQVMTGLYLHPGISYTKRLNIHFARMGEPTFNPNVLDATRWLFDSINRKYRLHPVVSTMMPNKNIWLKEFIISWMNIKNNLFQGEAGLQLSINSTNEKERKIMFSGNAHTLEQIAEIMKGIKPIGRKITLNFALAGYEIDPDILIKYFDPEYYIIKLTPMHKTNSAIDNNISTKGDYTTFTPYKETEEKLKAVGYNVLVFIASEEEDDSRITCGNAILSGSLPNGNYRELFYDKNAT
jgi:23S rRNA (adenine2503-C2)-methyltransferase